MWCIKWCTLWCTTKLPAKTCPSETVAAFGQSSSDHGRFGAPVHLCGDPGPNKTVGPTLGLSGPPGGSGASLRSKGCRTRSTTPGPACGARARESPHRPAVEAAIRVLKGSSGNYLAHSTPIFVRGPGKTASLPQHPRYIPSGVRSPLQSFGRASLSDGPACGPSATPGYRVTRRGSSPRGRRSPLRRAPGPRSGVAARPGAMRPLAARRWRPLRPLPGGQRRPGTCPRSGPP